MIVTGAFASSVRQSVERPAVSAPAAAAPEPEAGDPLAMLTDFVESAARARKVFAEDRLKFLREQMTKLSMFNLVPGALADHSARMARELESAANDFTGAVRTLVEGRTATDASATPPESYLDVMNAGPTGPVALSDADRETAATFVNVALHLNLVVDLAENDRGYDADRESESERARERTDRVVDMMNRLDGGAASGTWW